MIHRRDQSGAAAAHGGAGTSGGGGGSWVDGRFTFWRSRAAAAMTLESVDFTESGSISAASPLVPAPAGFSLGRRRRFLSPDLLRFRGGRRAK
nr:unnamed protein product [Digitaria exilis]